MNWLQMKTNKYMPHKIQDEIWTLKDIQSFPKISHFNITIDKITDIDSIVTIMIDKITDIDSIDAECLTNEIKYCLCGIFGSNQDIIRFLDTSSIIENGIKNSFFEVHTLYPNYTCR